MDRKIHALMLGSNRYINPIYNISYEVDEKTGDRNNLLTLENSNQGLLLTAEIRIEYMDLIASIKNNKITVLNDNYVGSGDLEKGNGLSVTRKDNGEVVFFAGITPEGDVAVSGTLFVGGMRLHISKDSLKIDDVTSGKVRNLVSQRNTYVGVGDIVITKDGVKI